MGFYTSGKRSGSGDHFSRRNDPSVTLTIKFKIVQRSVRRPWPWEEKGELITSGHMPPWLLSPWGSLMTNSTIAAPTPRSGSLNANVQRSLQGSIPLVLLSFATPSLVQILVQSTIAVVEIFLLSRLGTDVLAGISAVFPIVTLFVAITTVG